MVVEETATGSLGCFGQTVPQGKESAIQAKPSAVQFDDENNEFTLYVPVKRPSTAKGRQLVIPKRKYVSVTLISNRPFGN